MHWIPLELELQAVVNQVTWVLGIELDTLQEHALLTAEPRLQPGYKFEASLGDIRPCLKNQQNICFIQELQL